MKPEKKTIISIVLFLCVLCPAAAFLIYENHIVYKDCYAEAGVAVEARDFLTDPGREAYFAEDSDPVDITVPGDYHVKIKAGAFEHKSTLHIKDTIAPQGEPVRVNLELGQECGAQDFVTNIADATQVEVTYARQPDFTAAGRQDVAIALTDLGGNRTELSAELFVSQIVSELTVEAGEGAPELDDFIIEAQKAEFITNMDAIDYTAPADRTVQIRVDGIDCTAVMHIVDTKAPKVEVKDLDSFTNLPRKAEDFIVSVDDATAVKAEFTRAPDLTLIGGQKLEICVTDAGGNRTLKTVNLTLQSDTEAPLLSGVADLVAWVGGSVSYKKNVTVTDNCPEGLSLTVDNSAVNLNAEGVYPITYIARDASGNQTTASAHITVRARVYDVNEVYAIADGILADIITPEMDPGQKVEAIYKYVCSHIAYSDHSEKGDWVRAAYEGLVEGRGDCYVYASASKALLTRAGINNMDIEKIPTKSCHYWNLVDIGTGWYHFDTTPRRSDHPRICMWTEEQLMEYSKAHYNSHNYDHSLYPEVN